MGSGTRGLLGGVGDDELSPSLCPLCKMLSMEKPHRGCSCRSIIGKCPLGEKRLKKLLVEFLIYVCTKQCS